MNQSTALEALTPIAAEQAGFVTSRQAGLVEVPPMLLVQLARRGALRRVRRGVYEFAYGRASHPHQDLVAAWLAVEGDELPWRRSRDPRALVSHQSAAALAGLGTIIPGLPEITTHRRVGNRPGVRFHTAPFDARDWAWRSVGDVLLPVTTAPRTIVDLLLDNEEIDYLERAVVQAFRDPDEAREQLTSVSRRRRHPKRTQKLLADVGALVAGARWDTP